MTSRTYLSIGDVLTLLREEFPDVTISKIRFLESQGLVNPERSPSGYRKFFEHDVERLRWVLRQQREHFLPLKVIRDRLADGDLGDDVEAEQPNGKEARAAQAVAVAGDARATPMSSRQRPTKRRWRAFSPTHRAAPPSCPTRSRRDQGLQVVTEVEASPRAASEPAAVPRDLATAAPRRTASERRADATATLGGRPAGPAAPPAPPSKRRTAPTELRCPDRRMPP